MVLFRNHLSLGCLECRIQWCEPTKPIQLSTLSGLMNREEVPGKPLQLANGNAPKFFKAYFTLFSGMGIEEEHEKEDRVASKQFCSVFPSDQLLQAIDKYPCGFVANTDPSDTPRTHWVAFYLHSTVIDGLPVTTTMSF